MAYTLAELQQAVQDYCENTESTFVANIGNFIRNTEDLILQSVDLDVFHKLASISASNGVATVNKPADYLSPYSLYFTVAGTKRFLEIKERSFLLEYNPAGDTGAPKYYAANDSTTFLLAPVPNAALTGELEYMYRPASLADGAPSGTTWLSTNAPMAMLYGCLVEAYTFMKGEQDMMAQYKELFGIALNRLKDFGEAKENTDAYRMGMPTRVRS